jgi:hypothetical protein
MKATPLVRRKLALVRFLAFIFVTFSILRCQTVPAQIQQTWVARYNNGMTNGTNQAVKMELGSGGNVYVTGFSENTNTNLGYTTVKYAPNGNQLWAVRFDSTNYPTAAPSGLVLDNSNNVIVTGDALTIEYDSNGDLLWTAPYNAAAVGVDPSNNVYITGVFSNFETIKLNPTGSNLWTAVDTGLDPGPTSAMAIEVDSAGEAFVAGNEPRSQTNFDDYECLTVLKYTTTGSLVWRDRLYSNGVDAVGVSVGVSALALDAQTNLYLELGYTVPIEISYFTFKFGNSGNMIWLQRGPANAANAYSESYGMAVDSLGNAIVTGKNAYNYPSTSYGTYKLNTSGAYVWTNLYPSAPANSSAATAIAVDSANNVYVTGYSPGTNGYNDIVTIKYNASGGQVWLQRYSSPVPGNAAGNAIAVDANFNVYVAGYDTGPGGGTEMVVIKYSPVTLQVLSNGTVQLQAQGAAGELFDVQASSDLQTWQDLGQSAADTNGLFQFDDTNAPNYPARFYFTLPQ